MKFSAVAVLAAATAALTSATSVHLRVNVEKAGAPWCLNPATNQWIPQCAPGFECRNGRCEYATPQGGSNTNPGGWCLNPATNKWIPKCDPGFECRNNRCEYATNNNNNNNNGAWCLNPATGKWIPKCDPGFVCRNGRCDYA